VVNRRAGRGNGSGDSAIVRSGNCAAPVLSPHKFAARGRAPGGDGAAVFFPSVDE
jgi:hypothetical protein